jgi:hypothetical protein
MRIGDVSIRNIIDRAAAYQQSDFNTRVNSQPAAAWVGFRIRGADGRGHLRTACGSDSGRWSYGGQGGNGECCRQRS